LLRVLLALGALIINVLFLSVENLCFIIKELLENKRHSSGIYNVADDESLSTNELIELVGGSLEKRTVIWKIPSVFMVFFAKIGDYLYLPLNTERLQVDGKLYR
jgi:nucleoside-diphosphate-sugar epimerase